MLKLVPLGDGFYRDYKQFDALNYYLDKKVSEKIYREIIETGAWKQMIVPEKE